MYEDGVGKQHSIKILTVLCTCSVIKELCLWNL